MKLQALLKCLRRAIVVGAVVLPHVPAELAAAEPKPANAPPGKSGPASGSGPLKPGSPSAGAKARVAVEEARKHLGAPAKAGGSTPQTGFDNAGLVQWAYRRAGIQIPRTVQGQFNAPNGVKVARDQLAPGDLIFFSDKSGKIDHVAMSIGRDLLIHAPKKSDTVIISSLSVPQYSSQFAGAVRFDQTVKEGQK